MISVIYLYYAYYFDISYIIILSSTRLTRFSSDFNLFLLESSRYKYFFQL
jgi:hypothetical protein